MKKITYFIAVLLLLTAVTGCSFSMEDTKEWIDDTKKVNSREKKVNADPITAIEVDTKEISTKIKVTKGNQIKVQLVHVEKDTDLKVTERGNLLKIKAGEAPVVFGLNMNQPLLVISVPEKKYDSFQFKTGSANITSDKLSAKQLTFNTVHGDIDLKGFEGKKITGKTSDGDVNLKNVDSLFDIQTSLGNIKVSVVNGFKGVNKIKSQQGNIKVKVDQIPESLQVDLSTQSAKGIQTNFNTPPIEKSNHSRVLKGFIGKENAKAPQLLIKTSLGGIRLMKM